MTATLNPTDAIVAFLERIGFTIRLAPITRETFLPGIIIDHGTLVIDAPNLLYPGDLLHEAGHLAVMTPAERAACDGDTGTDAGMEMAAIAWSYAAALEIGIDPAIVFHADGYQSDLGGAAILTNFREGRYIGTPILQWLEMTSEPDPRNPQPPQPGVYPSMSKWLRDEPADS